MLVLIVTGDKIPLLQKCYEEEEKDYFSYEIVLILPAGPGHYLTLVHSRYKANGTVADEE